MNYIMALTRNVIIVKKYIVDVDHKNTGYKKISDKSPENGSIIYCITYARNKNILVIRNYNFRSVADTLLIVRAL